MLPAALLTLSQSPDVDNISHFAMKTSAKRHFPDFARSPVFKFIANRSGPFDGSVTLTRDRVYIVPTRSGLMFGLLVFILLIGSINYGKSLGFALTFLLVGIGNILLYTSWQNLAGLTIHSGGCPAVFSGDMAHFTIRVENPDAKPRQAIYLSQRGIDFDLVDISAKTIKTLQFQQKTQRRGRLNSQRFRLYTTFPSGLFIAWTWIELSMQCLVYPQPVDTANLPVSTSDNDNGNSKHPRGTGIEDFSQLEKFKPGDSWRHIDWKTTAKNNTLYSKHFSRGSLPQQWIDWYAINAATTELRLSIMTRLLIDANRENHFYGLILPNKKVTPDTGNTHYHQCLKLLALYNPDLHNG